MNDELDRIQRYRSDEPVATADAIESARNDLMAAIGAARSGGPRPVRRPSGRPSGRRRRWQGRGRGRLPRVVALAAAACVAAVVALALTAGSSSQTSAVAAMLRHLADVARQQSPVDAPGPGQYLYVDSVSANEVDAIGNGAECRALQRQHRQIWIGANGSGRLLETMGQANYFSAHDRALCAQMHAGLHPGTSDDWFAPRCLSVGFADKVPASSMDDPAALLQVMYSLDGGTRSAGEDFVHIGDLLRESDASPALRAAAYRAAATIPGVKLLGPTQDHLGRTGVGIGYSNGTAISELILDRQTSALLGEQTVDSATGKVSQWSAYRTSKIVNAIPGHAPGALSPPCVNGGGYDHQIGGSSITTGAPAS
jgi:hypothetical protein